MMKIHAKRRSKETLNQFVFRVKENFTASLIRLSWDS